MGADVYFYLVADRLIMWLIDVVGRCVSILIDFVVEGFGLMISFQVGNIT